MVIGLDFVLLDILTVRIEQQLSANEFYVS